ncbi:MAG TPA: DUF6263 family protein [Chitinophagaceae bacterium]|nr:DUF6263 family protein [Chitinophagaceae bacterium]
MKIKTLLVVAGIAYFILPGCKGSGDAIDFKFNVPKGTKFSYTVGMNMGMDQAVMGQSMKVASKITIAYLFEVLDDSAGGWKKIRTTISRFGMQMNANGMEMNFDTDTPSEDTTGPMAQVGKIFGALKGGQFVFTMNGDGKIGEITGIREMTDKIIAGMTSVDTSVARTSLDKAFNEENFKQNLQQSFAMYPGKPVKPGDSWSKSIEMNSNGMPMKLDNTYTLKSVEGDSIKVDVVSKITAGGSAMMQGMNLDITGDMKGINTFDKATGMPTSGDDNMKMDMKMKMQGQEVPMKMDIKVEITGKKL